MITLYNEKDEKIKLISVFEFNDADMGESSLSATISFDKEQNFHPDWYVIYNGEKFRLGVRKPTGKKDTSSLSTTYTLVFKSEREDLKRYTFMDFVELGTGNPQPSSYMVSLYATLSEFVDRFNINLSYYMGERWKMVLPSDYIEDGKFVSITFDNMSLWDVLLKVYEIWSVRWRIVAQNSVLNIQVGFPADEINHIFEYGKDNGLVSIERNNSLERIITRLRGRGGEKNLPASYFHSGDPDTNSFLQATFFKNLMPKSYRDYIRGYNAGSGTGSRAYNQGVADKVNGRVISPVDYVISDKEDLWGISYGAIEPNEYIFPTLQGIERDGSRLDTVIAVEEVIADSPDIKSDRETEIVDDIEIVSKGVYSPGGNDLYPSCIDPIELKKSVPFFVSKPYSTVDLKFRVDSLTMQQPSIGWTEEVSLGSDVILSGSIVLMNTDSAMVVAEVDIANDPSVEIHAENIEPGNYSFWINLQWKSSSKPLGTIVTCEFSLYDIKIDQYSSPALKDGFKPTFDIWIKDIWNIPRNSDETDEDYTYRVWSPLAVSEEMTVMFSDGLLAGEDYKFRVVGVTANADNLRSVIVDAIHLDNSMTFNGEQSAWRLKLEKSESELEASGRYLPNSKQNAKAGDHFFFVNIAMPYDPYVYEAEARVEAYLDEQLSLKDKEFPSFTIAPSSIFCKDFAEVDKLKAGSTIRVRNTSLIGDSPISLHIQSITKRYSDNKLNPDWTITLSDQIVATGSPVETLEGNINILASQVYSNKEAVKQATKQLSAVFLRKDGIDDVSYSPTIFKDIIKFEKDISDVSFDRTEGKGFGVYTDANGNRVVEADILIGRKGGGGGGTATTLGGLLNVDSLADTASAEDVVLFRASNDTSWSIKKLSELAGLDESALADYLSVNGYITESVLNGKNFATQLWVTQQAYLSEVTAQDIYNALGYTPASTDEISKGSLISTIGIADWALAVSKPSYDYNEINGTPTLLSEFTDDVVAGHYLPIGGGYFAKSLDYKSTSAHPLILGSTNATEQSVILLRHNDVDKAQVGWSSSSGTYLYNYTLQSRLGINNNGVAYFNDHALYHTGNFDPANYLPKSGGTINGSYNPLTLKSNDASLCQLTLYTNDKLRGIFQYNSNFGVGFSNSNVGGLYITNNSLPTYVDASNNIYTLLHANNYDSFALPLSGGTINGTTSSPLNINTSATNEIGLRLNMSGKSVAWVGYTPNIGIHLYSYGTNGVTHKLGLSDAGVGFLDSNTLIHSGNIGEQSVNYANSAGDANLLNGQTGEWYQNNILGFKIAGSRDANAEFFGIIHNYNSASDWANAPTGMSYGRIMNFSSTGSNALTGQLAWDVNHGSTTDTTRNLWWRAISAPANVAYAQWHQIAFTDSNVASASKLVTDSTTAVPKTVYANAGSNNVTFGYETAKVGFDTYLAGRNITLRIFEGETNKGGIVINNSGNVTIGASDLASTATKLYVDGGIRFAPRTIWGQSFDGTGDVSGDLVGVGSINSTLQLSNPSSVARLHIQGNSATVDYVHLFVSNASVTQIHRPLVVQKGFGNVLIGTTTDDGTSKLQVAGNISATGSITIGGATLTWDETNNCLRVNTNFAADGELTAGGVSDAAVVTEYDSATEIAELNRRITELENRLAAYEQ